MRIAMPLNKRHWKTIRQAAAIQQLPIKPIARTVVIERAQVVVRDHNTTKLTQCDMERLFKILDEPSKPGKALRNALKRYRKAVGNRRVGR